MSLIHDIGAPTKPHRKKVLEVPVHKPSTTTKTVVGNQYDTTKNRKTYSANFSKKCKHKTNNEENNKSVTTEVVLELPENKQHKKQLNKEIARLVSENSVLVIKFNELEELSVKKITKLREKINALQTVNAEFAKQNDFYKDQYGSIIEAYELMRNELELRKVCKNCAELSIELERLNEENKLLRKSNKELTEDLDMLKTVVYRLNSQLERYQEKLRKHNLHELKQVSSSNDVFLERNTVDNILSECHRTHKHTPVAWGSVNSHTLGPLLDAYQDSIKEKDELIQAYEQELTSFTGKLKEVVDENQTLYFKLTEDESCSVKLRQEVDNLRKELSIQRAQNDGLIKKCALKQDKIEEILKIYENKVEHMKRDYAVVHEEYIKCRTENAALIEKNKALHSSQDDFRNERSNYIPVSVHTASVNECKKWYEELKHQYEMEKQKLNENIESQTKIIETIRKDLSSMQKSKEELETKIVHMEKQVKKADAKHLDLEHTLNEVQLSRSACRKQLHKAMCFAKDMVSDQEKLLTTLNQRQMENKAVKKIGSEMASRMDSLKSQLKDVQKSAWQEFSTVEEKIQEQAELIDKMKLEHEVEVEKLQKIIKGYDAQAKDHSLHPVSQFTLFKEKYK